jgi:hypothetical protein
VLLRLGLATEPPAAGLSARGLQGWQGSGSPAPIQRLPGLRTPFEYLVDVAGSIL